MKAKFASPFAASPSSLRREPTNLELAGGFPCGGLDMQLWNELTYRLSELNAEVSNAVAAAGLAADETNLFQLTQSLARGIWIGNLQGTANAPTGIVGGIGSTLAIPALVPGMRLRGIAGLANTGPVTLAVTGITGAPASYTVLRGDGSALQAGDIKAGQLCTFDCDADGNLRIGSGGGSASTTLFMAAKAADQSLSNNTFTDVTWSSPASGSPPAFASAWNGVAFTAGQACRLLVIANLPLAIGVSGGNYSEAACAINLNGTDVAEGQMLINGAGGSGTQYPYVQASKVLDLVNTDVVKIRAAVNCPTYFSSGAARGVTPAFFCAFKIG